MLLRRRNPRWPTPDACEVWVGSLLIVYFVRGPRGGVPWARPRRPPRAIRRQRRAPGVSAPQRRGGGAALYPHGARRPGASPRRADAMRVELAARPARLVWVTVPPSEDTGDDARVGWFWRNRKRACVKW